MKKLILLIIPLFVAFTSMADDNTSYYAQQYEKGNTLYEQEKYEEALAVYQSINETGMFAAEIDYNIGNSYFKLGQIPHAIIYYEKALKIAPDDKDILYNLDIANSLITDKVAPLPQHIFSKIWDNILNTLSMDGWAWIAVVVFLIMNLSFFIYKISQLISIKKIFFFNAFLFMAFGFFAVVFAEIQKRSSVNDTYAIVFSPTVNLQSEPKAGSTKLYVIHEGLKVKVLHEKNDWVKVSLADGNIGWISMKAIEKI